MIGNRVIDVAFKGKDNDKEPLSTALKQSAGTLPRTMKTFEGNQLTDHSFIVRVYLSKKNARLTYSCLPFTSDFNRLTTQEKNVEEENFEGPFIEEISL